MPEDILLFYTDGITEAMNNNHDQFGADQLLTIFENTAKHRESSQAVIKNVLLAVEGFVGSAPQSDDITLLALKHS
jgi:phosphoserine phosphatase RsbU/P